MSPHESHGTLPPSSPTATGQRRRKKIMVVIGTRPEAIKLAPLVLALRHDPRYQSIVVTSGQHKEMLYPILDWFGIAPDHTLDVMRPGQPLAHLSGRLLDGLHMLMEAEQPDLVVVQGDTTTAFMAALTAYYAYDYFVRNEHGEPTGQRHHVEIAHVEAGLRTYDNYAPFPEEVNRRLISPLAHWHFAPTGTAAQALFDENITARVHITGNPVIDALHLTVERLATLKRPPPAGLTEEILNRKYVLITGHRRENYGEGFAHICDAIKTLARKYPELAFIYPVHLNQHVRGPVLEQLSGVPNVFLTAPADYPDFVHLMHRCHLILTDSGGVQEEGPALGKPVLVMREITERPEGIQAGTARIVGTTAAKIVAHVSELIDNLAAYEKMANAVNPYGDGQATRRILNLLAGEPGDDDVFQPGAPQQRPTAT